MKEEALALAAEVEDPARKLNLLREYLQAFTLRSLHEQEAFSAITFVGGTALRFLERLPRFSEDLDFSVAAAAVYKPVPWLKKLQTDLRLSGYDCTLRWSDRGIVHAAWLHFASLMHEAGLSSRPQQKLSIKLEIDTRPPAGGVIERSIVHKHLTFVVCHYDITSLMAGKLHALLARPYAKGRDWFDLVWYRARRPPVTPNLELLQNALDQKQGKKHCRASDWQRHLHAQLVKLKVEDLQRDVAAFLERPADLALLSRENLEAAIGLRRTSIGNGFGPEVRAARLRPRS